MIRLSRNLSILTVAAVLTSSPWKADAGELPPPVRTVFESTCLDCHTGESAEAGLDLAALMQSPNLSEAEQTGQWVLIHDRVAAGEMPPQDVDSLPDDERATYLREISRWIRETQQQTFAEHGRVRGRRLTNRQLELTLHALLGIDIPLALQMPDEPRTKGFTGVAGGQPMSHFQLEQHVSVVDTALDEAFRRALTPADEWQRQLSAQEIVRRNPRRRTREPELIDGSAVVWSSRLIFYGRIPATTAREDGWYRFKVRAKALKPPQQGGVWCTVRSGLCVSSAPLLGWVGAFEAQPETQEWVYETWLPAGHMLEIRPGDATLRAARFAGGQVGTGEGEPQNVPGVAIESIVMERIHREASDAELRECLFGDLTVTRSDGKVSGLSSEEPPRDLRRLLHRFAERAFRRPVDESLIEPYVDLALPFLEDDEGLVSALRGGYRALLCSPRFLYFTEEPGELDDFALASRLSYFLTNSMPDAELMALATQSRLRDPKILQQQAERLLAGATGRRFVEDLAAEWLDLSLIDFTEPDGKLFPDFDPIVQQSMLDETHAYLEHLLQEDLGIDHLIDSDFTFLNSRLARFYEINRVADDELQRVSLNADDRRGGLLTHGSILKVTANGTNTSPVIRGVWISERLLGCEVPPPPENVPAIEPDIRGAKTIREMLAKHKEDTSCATCHVKIDPPGFALENYDPAGRFREKYQVVERGRRRAGATVDAAYEMADGRPFKDLQEFKTRVLEDPHALAENFVDKLLTYGTGAPVQFVDRDHVQHIVDLAAESEFGMRSLVLAVVDSPVFRQK